MDVISVVTGGLAVLALGVFIGFSLADYVRERTMRESWTAGPNTFNFQNFRDVASLPRGVRIHPYPPPPTDEDERRSLSDFCIALRAADERAERAMG